MRDVDALAGDEGVKGVLWGALELHAKKSLDYGLENDSLANVRAAEEFGIPAWVGTVIRMNDKVIRIKSFLQKGTLANESLEDSLADIIVYAAIALRLYREVTPTSATGSAPEDQDTVGIPRLMVPPNGRPEHLEDRNCAYYCCEPVT